MAQLRTKYPRTRHLPWSPGATNDDAILSSVDHFTGHQVVVTEKMDGENSTLYRDGLHARSVDSRHHPSRDWLKAFHAGFADQIPEGWRICGENLYAEHSLRYENLLSYFYAFSIWDETNTCLSWDETAEWGTLLGLHLVPVLYSGPWDESLIHDLTDRLGTDEQEGIVVRLADRFPFHAFSESVAKWVRPNHVVTDQHWMHGDITPNQLSNTKQ